MTSIGPPQEVSAEKKTPQAVFFSVIASTRLQLMLVATMALIT
jgi:hypothetical protein